MTSHRPAELKPLNPLRRMRRERRLALVLFLAFLAVSAAAKFGAEYLPAQFDRGAVVESAGEPTH